MKTSRTTLLLATTALAGAAFVSGDAQAQDTLTIAATVPDACTVNAGGTMNFGNYQPGGGSVSTTGTFDIACVTPADVKINIDSGQNFDSVNGTRQMADGPGNFLQYYLYDPAGVNEWGDNNETHPASWYETSLASGPNTITVNGTIPAGQTPVGSDYTDTVTISLSF